MNKPTVTAAAVRSFYNADPKRLARLSDEARRTVLLVDGKAPKGRLHPEVIEDHNKRRKVQYVTGATKAAQAKAKAEATALRDQAAAAGFKGKRGPLPKAFRESLAATKA